MPMLLDFKPCQINKTFITHARRRMGEEGRSTNVYHVRRVRRSYRTCLLQRLRTRRAGLTGAHGVTAVKRARSASRQEGGFVMAQIACSARGMTLIDGLVP